MASLPRWACIRCCGSDFSIIIARSIARQLISLIIFVLITLAVAVVSHLRVRSAAQALRHADSAEKLALFERAASRGGAHPRGER
jgi:hypothetical protein